MSVYVTVIENDIWVSEGEHRMRCFCDRYFQFIQQQRTKRPLTSRNKIQVNIHRVCQYTHIWIYTPTHMPVRSHYTDVHSSVRVLKTIYNVSGKKETKMFLVISQKKLRRFSWNLMYGFLNKFAIKWCKRFPPHLNNVSTLPCKTWNVLCARATIELIQKQTPEFIPPQLWPPNSPDLNPVDYRVWEISQEKM